MWTKKRLLDLYQRYNRRYWSGELPLYGIEIKKCRRCIGVTDHGSRTVVVDVDGHFDDDQVRLTLLHEMVHVAALDSPPHGLDFWQEVDRILQRGAPPELLLPISRQLRAILRMQASALDLYYCKRAVRNLEAADRRLRQCEGESELEDRYWKTIEQFRTLAREATWTQALSRIGQRTGLLDGSGRPRSRRNANVVSLAKRRFQQERRWHLQRQRRAKSTIVRTPDRQHLKPPYSPSA